jgi:hypothetical protein
LIVTILALALFAVPGEQTADAAEQKPTLAIDACVEVDDATVENLVDLELRDTRGHGQDVPISVGVRCLDGTQEIRVEPWASLGGDGIRAIELPPADGADPAAREARSRELALAIAELIRRLEITHPLRPKPPPPPPAPSPQIAISASPDADEPGRRRWQLAALSSFEAYTGGQKLAGGDLFAAVPIGRWMLSEVRVGGRLVDGGTSPVAHLTGRAGTAAIAAGLNIWSKHRALGFALMLRAQGYAIEYQVASPDRGSQTALLGALTIIVEPRLLVAVSRRISLTAGVGAGIPLHGIRVRTQGVETDSLTGLVVSASLGALLTF